MHRRSLRSSSAGRCRGAVLGRGIPSQNTLQGILARRHDLKTLVEGAAPRIAAQLKNADPVRARYAREVLQAEPEPTPERFEKLVDDLVKRHPRLAPGSSSSRCSTS
jgi:hypothetical protein